MQIQNTSGYIVHMTGNTRGPQFYPLGTKVYSKMTGRSTGMVIGYNKGSGAYDDRRYPYVVLWEDGYIEVYSETSFSPVRDG